MATLIWSKVHNFGVYRRGGRRCILQLDFPGRMVLVIQKGRIKKSQNFDGLHHYDSEDGLHVSMKFGNTVIDFDADNAEEKYKICRLLGFILQIVHGEEDENIDCGLGLISLGEQQEERTDVIKEGLLEKKGSSAIATWHKRRIRLVAGEFSYYKPGEELALNIVQLWQDVLEVKKLAQNGFTFRVREKVYSFRVPGEYKALNMTEIVRNEWIIAFQQAFHQSPSTSKIFDPALNRNNSNDPEHIYDETPDMSDSFPLASAHDRMQLPVNNQSPGEITAHVTVHLNYIDKGVPLPRTFDSTWGSENLLSFKQDKAIKHPDSSAVPSVPDDPFSCSAAFLREKLEKQGGKSSSLKAYRSQHDFKEQQNKENGNVHTILKSYFSEESTLQIRQQSNDKKLAFNISSCKHPSNKSKKDSMKDSKGSILASPSSKVPKQKGAKRIIAMPPPPLPPPFHHGCPPGGPPLPPGSPPPVPPLIMNNDSVKPQHRSNVKLKQVHWVKVSSNQVGASMWRDARDMTSRLDLAELEKQFSVQEMKIVAAKPKLQEDKEMLIDAKRAQNLGILFCGLKTENISKLTTALSSTTECESFPADKMATFKRYQPTNEDREMYKAYADKQESLHHVDFFMLKLCEIPYLSLRTDIALTIWEFPDRYASLEEEVNDLLNGCEEILTSTQLTAVLEYLLAIGNYMNTLWNAKQGVQGFQLSSIEKILSVKGHDSQMTLCTYLANQIKISQPDLMNWSKSLGHVTRCTSYSIKAVGAEIDVLKNDLQKMKKILKTLRSQPSFEDRVDIRFQADVQNLIVEYECKVDQMDHKYVKVTDKYKQLLAKFGEPPNKTTESIFSYVSLFMEKFQQATEKLK